jgi:hypothetical protein
MENNKKTWSEEDIKFLIENYEIKGSKFCSQHLLRKTKAIIVKAKRLGLKSGKNGFKYSKDYLEPIIKSSKNIKEVLDKMGLRAAGGNYGIINKYIKLFNIDVEHFKYFEKERISNLVKLSLLTEIPLKDVLVENSNYNRTKLKSRLYKEGLKKRECELCGQGEEWMGKKMSLILDHINGVYNDNRIKNLRIVCPNCNATLDTHCGKNLKK